MMNEQEKDVIKILSDDARTVGNIIKSTKKNAIEKILEMIEKVSINFDEYRNPHPL